MRHPAIDEPRILKVVAAALVLAFALAATPLVGQERTFRPLRSLGGGSELTASVSLGDVNGDGALDVVVANGRHWPAQNRVYLNGGNAAFTLARRLGGEEAGSYAVPLADFDGDGDLDVAVGNDRTRNLIFFNDGTGRFEAGAAFGTPSSTRSLTLADLDGDGHVDILVVNRGRQNFIFHGDGSGAFRERTPFGAGDDSTIDVVAADLDGDGDPDLVLANRDGGANTIHWNDGGSFERVSGYGTGSDETRGVAVGDVDGDGALDIVTANIGESNGVYFGDGSGRVRQQPAVRTGRRRELRGPSRGPGPRRGRGHCRCERGRAERGLLQPGRRAPGVRRVPLRVRGLLDLRAGGRGSERRRVPRHRDREFRDSERPLRECSGPTRLEDLVSRQRRRLPDPAHQELLVGLVFLVDVEIAHVLVP